MDMVTGAGVAVTLVVPQPREVMWQRITAVTRIGEWSPETIAAYADEDFKPVAGARFIGHNRFPNGVEADITCEVVEADEPVTFAWVTLDDVGRVGSAWRCTLREGEQPGTTVVEQSFTHGPGATGARGTTDAEFRDRLLTLCRNMTTTIAAMAAAD